MPAGDTLAGVKAGRAFIVIDAVDRTGAVLARVGRRMRMWGAQVQAFASQVARSMAIALAPVGLGLRAFMSFDDAMRRVEARTKATAEQMDRLRKQVRDLGRDTASTAVQVANLQAILAQRGFNPEQILEMTAAIRDLSSAAGAGLNSDITTAAETVVSVLNTFQMEAEDAARVSDILSFAVNNSAFTLKGLSDALSKGVALAADFGLSLEEVVAAMAAMTNLGIPASEAGTAFKTFTARFTRGSLTGKFNEELEKLTGNIVEFADKSGNLRKPLDILQDIADVTEGMGTAHRGELLSSLFGVRQFSRATAAVRGTAGALELLEGLMNESQGTAKETADLMEGGFGGAFRRVKSTIVDLGITIGEVFGAELVNMELRIRGFISVIADWILENKKLVVSIVAWTLKVLAAAVAVKLFGVAVSLLGVGLSVLGVAFSTAAILIKLAVAGVLAFAAASGVAIVVVGQLSAAVIGIGASMVAGLHLAITAIVTFIGAMFSITSAAAGVILFVANFWLAVVAGLIIGGVITIVARLVGGLAQAIAGIGMGIINGLRAAFNAVVAFVGDVLSVFQALGQDLHELFGIVTQIFQSGDAEKAAKASAVAIEIAFRTMFLNLRKAWGSFLDDWTDEWAARIIIVQGRLEGISDEELMQRLQESQSIGQQRRERTDPKIDKLRRELDLLRFDVDGDGNISQAELFGGGSGKPQEGQKSALAALLEELKQSPAKTAMALSEPLSRVTASMESRQRSTILEIERLRNKERDPLNKLLEIAEEELGHLANIDENIGDGGVAVLGN